MPESIPSPTPRCPTCGTPLAQYTNGGTVIAHHACLSCERSVPNKQVVYLPTTPVPSLSRFFASIFKK